MTEETSGPMTDEKLAKTLFVACEMVKNCFQDGAPFKVTLVLRCEVDRTAHVSCGDDTFEGAIEALQDLAATKDLKAQIVSRTGNVPKGTVQ